MIKFKVNNEAISIADYDSNNEKELSIKKNELVFVIEESDKGWSFCINLIIFR
jgi:hypothetical protein